MKKITIQEFKKEAIEYFRNQAKNESDVLIQDAILKGLEKSEEFTLLEEYVEWIKTREKETSQMLEKKVEAEIVNYHNVITQQVRILFELIKIALGENTRSPELAAIYIEILGEDKIDLKIVEDKNLPDDKSVLL